MGCRLSKDETVVLHSEDMFRENDKIDYKSRYERKMCLAKETPEPDYDLSDCNLKEVPSGVFVLCRVLRKETLDLCKNKLTSFDGSQYSDLSLLQVLNLSYNKIKKLPEDICQLENLRELNISNNLINKLPKTINGLKYLEMLDVSFNDLKSIDEINCMFRLKILNLMGNRRLKTIPNTLATCDNLYDLVLDEDTIQWPPADIISGGTSVVIQFLTTCEASAIPQDSDKVDFAQEAIKINMHNNKVNEVDRHEEKGKMAHIVDTYGNENALLEELHLRQMKQKEQILHAVLQRQNETETLVTKIQQEKDTERNKLISDILAAQENYNLVIEGLLALKVSPDPILLDKERMEEEKLLENLRLNHSELRKQEILSTMLETLQSEESKVQSYQQWRDASSKSVLERENETIERLSQFFIDYEANRSGIVEKICYDEELQKDAVAALIAKNDARTWGLVEQLKIVEAQLANMTVLEIEKKNSSNSEQMNDLADKRIRLTNVLMELLQQKENRNKELLDTLLSMEAQKRNEDDFWLLQYQRLIDSRPLEFSLKTNTIDPLLGYIFLVNGVIHCLPFLKKLWQDPNFCMETLTEDDLEATGIKDQRNRRLILRSIEEFLGTSNKCDGERPTAPPMPLPQEEASNSTVSIEDRKPVYSENFTECIICMEEIVKIIFVPCGHMCCCLNCQQKVDICPLCRAIIDRKIKVIQP